MFGFGENRESAMKAMWTDARAQNSSAIGAISTFQRNAYGAEYSREEVNSFLKKHLTLK